MAANDSADHDTLTGIAQRAAIAAAAKATLIESIDEEHVRCTECKTVDSTDGDLLVTFNSLTRVYESCHACGAHRSVRLFP